MIREMVEAFVDAKMDRADVSVALYQVAADVGGPALIKRINQRSRKTVEAMLGPSSRRSSLHSLIQGMIRHCKQAITPTTGQ
jgi:hypothetical protein